MKEKADPQAVAAFHFFSDPDAPENIELSAGRSL